MQIQLIGSAAGKADIKMSLVDSNGESENLVSKMNIDSKGFQFTGFKVRGKLKLLPGVSDIQCKN